MNNSADDNREIFDAYKKSRSIEDRNKIVEKYLYIVNIQHTYFVKDNLDISVDTQIPHPHGHGAPVINNMNDWTISE